jgi:hypothetical protein
MAELPPNMTERGKSLRITDEGVIRIDGFSIMFKSDHPNAFHVRRDEWEAVRGWIDAKLSKAGA